MPKVREVRGGASRESQRGLPGSRAFTLKKREQIIGREGWRVTILTSREHWNQRMEVTGKMGSLYLKKCITILFGVSHGSSPMLFHAISNQIDHSLAREPLP